MNAEQAKQKNIFLRITNSFNLSLHHSMILRLCENEEEAEKEEIE